MRENVHGGYEFSVGLKPHDFFQGEGGRTGQGAKRCLHDTILAKINTMGSALTRSKSRDRPMDQTGSRHNSHHRCEARAVIEVCFQKEAGTFAYASMLQSPMADVILVACHSPKKPHHVARNSHDARRIDEDAFKWRLPVLHCFPACT